MGEKPKSIEQAETPNPVNAEIGWVRRASYATINGLNNAAEFGLTATAYTVGRAGRTIKESAMNLMKGARGGVYGSAV